MMARISCCGLFPRCRGKLVGNQDEVDPPARIPDNSTPRSGSPLTALISDNGDPRFIACEVWAAAYDALKQDPKFKPLVDNYEEFFETLLWPKSHKRSPVDTAASSTRGEPDNLHRPRASTEMSEARFRTAAQLYTEIAQPYDKASGIASSAARFITKIKDAVGAVLASSPPASFAWAGVCLVVLPVVLNHSEQIAAKQTGFNYVMSRFFWYDQVLCLLDREHWKNQQSFSALRKAIQVEIVNLYKLLIEYQLRAYYAYCRPLVTISRDVFKLDDWDDMLANIKEAEKRLQEYMDLNFEQHILDNLHSLSEEARRKQTAEMTLKFKFPDELPYEVYQSCVNRVSPLHPGTGKGITSHRKFISWASATSGMFLLTAIPGSGKSVISKSMLTILPSLRATTVCSFFFKDSANGHNRATTALCHILDELFAARIALIDKVMPRIEHLLPQQIRGDLHLLWSILEDATADTDPGDFTIVLDAIDECCREQAVDLCNLIDSYMKKPNPRIKFFITSRPLLVFSFESSRITVMSTTDPEGLSALSKDIDTVTASRFEEFARRYISDSDLKKELFELIKPHEERTYLYIKLVFDYLDAKVKDGLPRVPSDWIEVFKALPTTVREAYSGFLGDVRLAHRRDVRLMLQMVVAAARPLTVVEINIALNIRDHTRGNPRGLGLQSEESFQHWILDACRCLLDVHDGRVYFIHKTARDYLLAGQGTNGSSPPNWLGNFTLASCHETLAESCLAYLCLPFACKGKFHDELTALPKEDTDDDGDDHGHQWKMQDLGFSNYASIYYRAHLTSSLALSCDSAVLPAQLSERLAIIWSWSRGFLTRVTPKFPSNFVNLVDYGQINEILKPEVTYDLLPAGELFFSDLGREEPKAFMEEEPDTTGLQVCLAVDNDQNVIIKGYDNQPVPRILRIPATSPDLVERVANALYPITLFRSVSAITGYQEFSPIPQDWFSVRLTGVSLVDVTRKTTVIKLSLGERGSPIQTVIMDLRHGDTLSFQLMNKTKTIPVSAHMLCLNSSWSIDSPVWNEQIAPGQEKNGSLAMIVPRKLNDYDSDTVEDEFIVIFVAGESHSFKCGWNNLDEWLKTVYMPPILPPTPSDSDGVEKPSRACLGRGQDRYLPFVPPPNWQVWRFSVKTSRSIPHGQK